MQAEEIKQDWIPLFGVLKSVQFWESLGPV